MMTVSFHKIASTIPELIIKLQQDASLNLEEIAIWNAPGEIDEDYYPFCIVLSGKSENRIEEIKKVCEEFLPCSVYCYKFSSITPHRQSEFLLNRIQYSELPLGNTSVIAEKIANLFGLEKEEEIFTLREVEESDTSDIEPIKPSEHIVTHANKGFLFGTGYLEHFKRFKRPLGAVDSHQIHSEKKIKK